jgi:hypothetical protein
MPSDSASHFFCIGEKFTYCNQVVTKDTILSSDPTCHACREMIRIHENYLAAFDTPEREDEVPNGLDE